MTPVVVDGSALAPSSAEAKRTLAAVVFSTGEPAYAAQFGGREEAIAALTAWLDRDGSEFSLANARVALDGDGAVAGACFVMNGRALAKARLADSLVAMRRTDGATRKRYLDLLQDAKTLAPPPPDDGEFLSGIGVRPSRRGGGVGRLLLEDWLRRGRGRGTGVFQLNVAADNEAARRLYGRFGFEPVGGGALPSIGVSIVTMRLAM